MERLWYASFERDRVASVKIVQLILCFWVSLSCVELCPDLAFADTIAPNPVVLVTPQAEQVFLNLPAFDLERVVPDQSNSAGNTAGNTVGNTPGNGAVNTLEKEARASKVGDELQLKIVGIHLADIHDVSKELTLSVAPSEKEQQTLDDQGWDLNPQALNHPQMQSEYLFRATPLKPGKLTLPSLVLKDASGKMVGRTNPFNVEVISAIKPSDPKPEEPEDLEPPVSLQFPWWVLVIFFLIATIGLGGLGYGIYRWRKNKNGLQTKKPEIVKSEDELALAKLAELEKLGLLKRGDFKGHYFKVSEILKAYVGSRYRFDALESTTQEMIMLLEEKMAVNAALIDQLETVFNKMDRVKFTDHIPASEEASRLIEEAKEFVVVTRRPPMILNQPGVGQHASG